MNCLQFRRLKLADPRHLSPEALEHGRNCGECRVLARSIDAGEENLSAGLAVSIPEGLADRVLLAHRQRARPVWMAWGLAAGVVAAVALGVVQWQAPPHSGDYAREAIDHVIMEPESLARTGGDGAMLVTAMHKLGASLKEPIGTVRFIRLCPIEGGGTGWHVVFESPHGLATLFLVPERRVGASMTASLAGWTAIVQPLPRGYYAVVSDSPQATAALDQLIRDSIETRG